MSKIPKMFCKGCEKWKFLIATFWVRCKRAKTGFMIYQCKLCAKKAQKARSRASRGRTLREITGSPSYFGANKIKKS